MVNLFANHAVLGALSQPQARMIDRPDLSYGLFHLHAQPIKLYGTLTTRVDFKGLNLDIGHLRSLRWSQANDPAVWVSYNRLRGQQASALEHATPEQFWVDRKQCRYPDENGQTVNPTLADCPQAVSAVKALAIAASQGQKIYTITQKNAAVALPQLSVSRSVAAEIKNAVAVGKEVTVHEKAISAHGFSGVGYILVDPETGAGAYLIEGGGNGGSLRLPIAAGFIIFGLVLALITLIFLPLLIGFFIEATLLNVLMAMFITSSSSIATGILLMNGDYTKCGLTTTILAASPLYLILSTIPLTAGLSVLINVVLANIPGWYLGVIACQP